MYIIGIRLRLVSPIVGKKNQFEEGLIGEIVEKIERPDNNSYRIQFNDGRIAVLPEHILNQSSRLIDG